MSLLVHAYVRDAEGEMHLIEPDDPSGELAGFESYRQTLYGSPAAVLLGLKPLPYLAEGDISAEGDDLARLRADVELALDNLREFEMEAGAGVEDLRPRFENIRDAILQAELAGGGGSSSGSDRPADPNDRGSPVVTSRLERVRLRG